MRKPPREAAVHQIHDQRGEEPLLQEHPRHPKCLRLAVLPLRRRRGLHDRRVHLDRHVRRQLAQAESRVQLQESHPV